MRNEKLAPVQDRHNHRPYRTRRQRPQNMKWLRKFFFRAMVLYIGVFAIFWLLRHALIYPLDSSHHDPRTLGLTAVREQKLIARDGVKLVIWTARPKPGRPVILYFHGNAGNLATRARRFRMITGQGYGLVAMAYRGSSGSQGKPTEVDITKDALLTYAALPRLLGTPPSRIIFYGESLGSGIASKLASLKRADGLILEAPFTSLAERAQAQLPFFPVNLLLDERWDTMRHIKTLKPPLLILHGKKDLVVPFENGQRVLAAAGTPSKRLIPFSSGTHANLWSLGAGSQSFRFIERIE